MNKDELLYKYFSVQLTPQEEKELKKVLDSDGEFKEQFEFEKNLQKGLKHKKRKELKGKLIQYEKTKAPVKSSNNKQLQRIAASVVIIIGLGWLGYSSFQPNYSNLFEDNFQPYPNTVYPITRSDTIDSIERKAFVSYEEGDYNRAIIYFSEYLSEPNIDQKKGEDIKFYIAISQALSNNSKRAKQIYRELLAGDANFSSEALWYLSLENLKEKRKSKATRRLKALIVKGDYKKEQAQQLLDELD